MNRRGILRGVIAGAAVAVLSVPTAVMAQQTGRVLGTVQIKQDVMANGERLAAGTYQVRQVDLPVEPVIGQTIGQSRWVVFEQKGQQRGRQLATVLTPAQLTPILNRGSRPPAAGRSSVALLKDKEHVRVWFNSGGLHYLVHLSTAGSGS